MLFTIRYRHPRTGVQTDLIDASSPAKADAVAHAWIDREPGYKFIAVTPAVVADESILPVPLPAQKGRAA